jgi:hypothetical protein
VILGVQEIVRTCGSLPNNANNYQVKGIASETQDFWSNIHQYVHILAPPYSQDDGEDVATSLTYTQSENIDITGNSPSQSRYSPPTDLAFGIGRMWRYGDAGQINYVTVPLLPGVLLEPPAEDNLKAVSIDLGVPPGQLAEPGTQYQARVAFKNESTLNTYNHLCMEKNVCIFLCCLIV